jgi:hypothetical protein
MPAYEIIAACWLMRAYTVGQLVGSPQNNGPECMAPATGS